MKKILIIAVLLAFLTAHNNSTAQDKDSSACMIDISLQECMDNSKSITQEMKKCLSDACEKWELELEKYYNLLMEVLEEEPRKSLEESQQAWIKFKDLEFSNFIPNYFQDIGSYIGPSIMESKMLIIRARALQLKSYYDTIQE